MSLIRERCDQVRDQVTIEQVFDVLGWDLPQRGRVRCIWPDHEDRTPAMQVYRDTNSVHCFACNKGGDVVEVIHLCGNPEGGPWDLDEALDWAEDTFGLQKLTPAKTLKTRLQKKLAKVHAPAPTTVGNRKSLAQLVHQAFLDVEKRANADQLMFAGNIKDYVWSELDDPDTDPEEWVTWARKMAYGIYAKTLYAIDFPLPVPPDIIDDLPSTCRRARAWEAHRDSEYPSPWHLQLLGL